MSNAQPPASPAATSNVASLLDTQHTDTKTTDGNQQTGAGSSPGEPPKTDTKTTKPTEPKPLSGVDRIKAERARQLKLDHVSNETDDSYAPGQLSQAALCYVRASIHEQRHHETLPPSADWPWHQDYWRPGSDPVRMLEKAGALIAAEIDKIQRSRSTKAAA